MRLVDLGGGDDCHSTSICVNIFIYLYIRIFIVLSSNIMFMKKDTVD